MTMLSSEAQAQALVDLFKQGTALNYKRGEYIIRPGEPPRHVYYIEKGRVKAFNISKYGEENLLIIRKEHEIFPLIWSISGQERHIIYQTLTPTTVLRITPEDFQAFMTGNKKTLAPILDMVTEMYRIHSDRLLNLQYRTVRERLVSFLITMANRFGYKNGEGTHIDVPLRHQDIASSVNSTRETISRELTKLENKGIINNSQGYITIKDMPKLKSYL